LGDPADFYADSAQNTLRVVEIFGPVIQSKDRV
jgi:hypothetical protein